MIWWIVLFQDINVFVFSYMEGVYLLDLYILIIITFIKQHIAYVVSL